MLLFKSIKKTTIFILVLSISLSAIPITHTAQATEEKNANLYYDTTSIDELDRVLSQYITIESNRHFVLNSNAEEIGINETAYNDKLLTLQFMNSLIDDGWINVDNDSNIEFTQKYIDSLKQNIPKNNVIRTEKMLSVLSI